MTRTTKNTRKLTRTQLATVKGGTYNRADFFQDALVVHPLTDYRNPIRPEVRFQSQYWGHKGW